MGSYGRNFEFRVPPQSEDRMGRYSTPATGTALVIGAPVTADHTAGFDGLGLQIVKLAAQASAPVIGECGIAVYEYGPAAFAGQDPWLTTYSDLGTVPLGKALQVVRGRQAKVVLTNTPARTFLNSRTYAARTMVNGLGATATVVEGDYLVPGAGDDVNGYWQSQASATGAWMVITKVDATRGEVEARLLV